MAWEPRSGEKIPQETPVFITALKERLGDPPDLVFTAAGEGITVAYLASLVEASELAGGVLDPLRRMGEGTEKFSWRNLLQSLPAREIRGRENLAEAVEDLLSGYALVHLAGSGTVYSFVVSRPFRWPPTQPQIERTIRGSRLSFPEALAEAVRLVRTRLRDASLRVEGFFLGRRTRTAIALFYLVDVADPGLVEEIRRRLSRIEIDGIVDSGYLEQLITDNRRSLFPLTQSTERPDKGVAAILEGRAAILVDGSPTAILVPATINELYQSSDDYYYGLFHGSFLRFFRVLGNLLAVALPGLYVALLGVNPELLPIKFALVVAQSRAGVALPLILEILLMEIIIEIFREGSLRLPTTIGQTIGVAAGVVLGIAGVEAGIVSSATLVVVVITAIASYSGPNYEVGITWRILRFGMLFAAIFLGLFGLAVFGLVILTHAANQNSFGVSYLAPWAPMRPRALFDTITRRPLAQNRRAGTYHPAEEDRLRLKEREEE
ncbi:MAG: spore germination protein [Firmicutes bacterium]|nr:spore germination protein [Bacillota bacterium]